MIQVWLVILALWCEYTAEHMSTEIRVQRMRLLSLFFAILSVVLFFVNGGTTG